MPVVSENPFAILTAVVAPAILTNACSVLSLGTANRIARVVDRTRVVAAARSSLEEGNVEYQRYSQELEHLAIRGRWLMTALGAFYASLGAFAASALAAITGSALAAFDVQIAFRAAAVAGFGAGSLGVVGLAWGCVLMVRETRVAIRSMDEVRQHLL